MAILGKVNLKALFRNGLVPTEQDFSDLIDSCVNKRDDHFFGRWTPGAKYCKGDVVIYQKSLYMLTLGGEEAVEECPPEEEEGTGAAQSREMEEENNCLCSDEPPPDNGNWCLLELEIEDADWTVTTADDGVTEIMYTKVKGVLVGIDTEHPDAKLDVTDPEKGQFLFHPENAAEPVLLINKKEEGEETETFLRQSLSDIAAWLTDAPLGYVFKIAGENGEEPGDPDVEQQARAVVPQPAEEQWLMLITSEGQEPRIGIGMDESTQPQAALDVRTLEKGEVLVNPGTKNAPEIILLSLDPGGNKNYLAAGVGNDFVTLTTDAQQGLRFKRGDIYSKFKQDDMVDHGPTLVTLHGSGKVGVGTEEPKTHLHVTDNESGEFRMGLNKPNPAFSIINIRTKSQSNYLTLGADNDQSAFVTDSEDGFVFRNGEQYDPKEEHEENLNQGEDLVRVNSKVKVGEADRGDLRMTPTLDINGISRAYSQYLIADRNQMKKDPTVLENVLKDICKLQPIRFRWDNAKTRIGDTGDQLGLLAHEVEEHFPEVVIKSPDGSKSVAYQNLVPALITALQELTDRVEELERKLEGGSGS